MAGYVIKSEYLNKSLGKLFVDHDITTVGKKFLLITKVVLWSNEFGLYIA